MSDGPEWNEGDELAELAARVAAEQRRNEELRIRAEQLISYAEQLADARQRELRRRGARYPISPHVRRTDPENDFGEVLDQPFRRDVTGSLGEPRQHQLADPAEGEEGLAPQ